MLSVSRETQARWKWYALLALSILAAYGAVWMFTDKTPWMHTAYCSYALQAERWLSGHLDLGQDYPWLELAIYQGKYYVSFPPLPTLLVMPFVALFGVDGTPEYLIAAAMSLIGAIQLSGCSACTVRTSAGPWPGHCWPLSAPTSC